MPVQLADLMFGVPVVVVPEVQVAPVVFREPRVFRFLDEELEVEAVLVVAPPAAVPPRAPAPMCMASRRPLTAGQRKVLYRARWNEWRERDLESGGGAMDEIAYQAEEWAGFHDT